MKNQVEEVMEIVCAPKYLEEGESFKEGMSRIADTLKDNEDHFQTCQDILLDRRFLPAGRIQASIGAARKTTAFNCYVSNTIEDSMASIMNRLAEASETMRLGGGDGFDFSTLRPKNAIIKSLGSTSSGPISFMGMWDAMCETIKSAGHRRGAMMAVMRIDHPDIEEFITCKQKAGFLTNFNISVAVTEEFMEAVKNDGDFNLTFPCGSDNVYKVVNARMLWNKIMRNTWDHAEPGVLFIDRINTKNNLAYCETIASTNPCLHGDTLVETVDGRKKIKDIKGPIGVYTMLPDGSLGVRQASASWKTKKNAKTVVVTVGSGKKVTCTPDHKIFVRNRGWVEAQDLSKGDELIHLCRARRGSAYSGVKLSTEDNRAYRMEHRFQYEGNWGHIQPGHDVHHIDGDTYNNRFSNLCELSHSEHSTVTRFGCDNNHQVKGEDGRWASNNSDYRKPVVKMPEELKSNLKNQKRACVVSVIEGSDADVYDMTVEDTHNFIADFLVVHNCGEQPLPPNGACLLGSFNLTKYCELNETDEIDREYPPNPYLMPEFNWEQFQKDIAPIVRMMDNVIDNTMYPLKDQEIEAKNKRRMGLGITGVANVISFLGMVYGSEESLNFVEKLMTMLRNESYYTSTVLAEEKGAFPLFDKDQYAEGEFIKTLPLDIQARIYQHGIRNSHLLSIAPTGTISLWAGNISSGIEPVFAHSYYRNVYMPDGTKKEFYVEDYAYSEWGIKGETSANISAKAHIDVLCAASRLVDSACSKTCNVGSNVNFEEFKDLYLRAYEGGASGCTTFRPAALEEKFAKSRGAVLSTKSRIGTEVTEEDLEEGAACFVDPVTGERTCAD